MGTFDHNGLHFEVRDDVVLFQLILHFHILEYSGNIVIGFLIRKEKVVKDTFFSNNFQIKFLFESHKSLLR